MPKFINLEPSPTDYARIGARIARNIVSLTPSAKHDSVKIQMTSVIEVAAHIGSQPNAKANLAIFLQHVTRA
jgi:hypothetical protein